MATHTETQKLVQYTASNFPTMGKPERFIATELAKIQTSVGKIIEVMKLMEARMNANNLT